MVLTAERLYDIVADKFDEEFGYLDNQINKIGENDMSYEYDTDILLYSRETGDVFLIFFKRLEYMVNSERWVDCFLDEFDDEEFELKPAKAISIVKYVTEL